jgi:hypothetical protein
MAARYRIICLSLALATLVLANVQAARADQLIITALIPARPDHFQLELGTPTTVIKQGQIITVTLTYGSYLPQATDTTVLVVSWQQQSAEPVITYVTNSATPAIQGSQPVYNPSQSTLTWVINPMPPGVNRQVSWQLHLDPQSQATLEHLITINAQLTASGLSPHPSNCSSYRNQAANLQSPPALNQLRSQLK